MSDGATPALGLSIGATNFAAVTADQAITRKPVMTLFRERVPEIGVPGENPRLDQPGLVITDFVDRVGDPIGIVAADGSVHRSEVLAADGLRALAYAATNGADLPENVAVTHPAHWGSNAVDALGSALSRVPEWANRDRPLTLIPDAAATLFAARANPGIPARGTVAVCDFGGSGSSITLMDAAGDYQPLAPTVRHLDFSGDLIDQALLTTVLANLPSADSFDPSGTSAIGPLSRLRTGCRTAKEQLSTSTVATLAEGLPGIPGEIRLTRNELDDAIRTSLTNFVAVLDETLARNGIRDLVAVVSVGGGANIPAVTTMLSGHLRVPVVTTPRPQLAPAIGAALRATRGPAETSATLLTPSVSRATAAAMAAAPAAPVAVEERQPVLTHASEPVSSLMPALAWSEAADESRMMPAAAAQIPNHVGGSGYTSARPALNFEQPAQPRREKKAPVVPWSRLPGMVVIGTAVAVLLVGIALAIGLSDDKPATTPNPGVKTSPATAPPANGAGPQPVPPSQAPITGQAAPQPAAPPPTADAPAPAAVDTPPPAAVDTPPPAAIDTPVPAAPPPPPVEAPAPPPVPQIPAPAPHVPPIPAIPPIPRIPGLGLPIPGFGG
ncbi:MAG: Hsp70 family protein [Actinomycetota bacterium]|uniref:Hsp70 family protein n=1 Tax=Mycobacterium lentiflavum TaxID=141349 RepID=A0ABY3UQE3_MYCLN|nr:Hsp70 family protein [Mycobacterium lentiflavum]MEE3062760.1 Hsp70 family protein [Actinomycetota bacterium]ULP40652.1 Hsp70 family protein [Mycobacterium lentiflavum]